MPDLPLSSESGTLTVITLSGRGTWSGWPEKGTKVRVRFETMEEVTGLFISRRLLGWKSWRVKLVVTPDVAKKVASFDAIQDLDA